jgi:hypothetical protein
VDNQARCGQLRAQEAAALDELEEEDEDPDEPDLSEELDFDESDEPDLEVDPASLVDFSEDVPVVADLAGCLSSDLPADVLSLDPSGFARLSVR